MAWMAINGCEQQRCFYRCLFFYFLISTFNREGWLNLVFAVRIVGCMARRRTSVFSIVSFLCSIHFTWNPWIIHIFFLRMTSPKRYRDWSRLQTWLKRKSNHDFSNVLQVVDAGFARTANMAGFLCPTPKPKRPHGKHGNRFEHRTDSIIAW